MKKFGLMMLAAGLLSVSAPVFAMDHEAMANEKDECLLASHGCATTAKTITEQLATLQKEIKKGDKVYTKEELDKLSAKLEEAEKMLRTLLKR